MENYNIYRDGSLIATPATSPFSDIGLTPATQYCYQISAVDVPGNESGKSAQVCATTPDTINPNQPIGLTLAVISETQIDLSWTAQPDNVGVTGYNIYRGGLLLKSVTGTATSDTGLAVATQYCYQVSALDAASNESAKSTQVCGTTPDATAPTQPLSLFVTAISGTQINLSWDTSTDNIGVTAYKVYRGGVYLKQVSGTSTSDIGLTPATQYCYEISAIDAVPNESGKSAQVCATTPDTINPNQPIGLTLAVISETQIGLSWIAPSDNVGVTGYNVYSEGLFLKTVTGTSTSDTGLAVATQYCYQVSALDAAANESALTSQQCITIDLTPPTVPSGLTAYAVSQTDIALSWAASTDNLGVAGYRIYRGGTLVTTVTGISYLDSGLTFATNYCYTVSAVDVGNNESQSAQSCVTTPDFVHVPDTGQTVSYTATFGEDHDYTYNTPSYTDNGDRTITDNITGLIWQKQDDGTARTWDAANTYCSNNTAGLPGTGWRTPTPMELLTIADYGTYNPAINTTYFPGTSAYYYWSSSAYADYTYYAWYVNFNGGNAGSNGGKSSAYYVRCVRGQ